ncbi:MAG: tetratricopeptide repeat protein [Microcoleus sp.]
MHRIMRQKINAIGVTLLISLFGPLLPFTSRLEPLVAQAKSPQQLANEAETWQEFISERGGFSVLMPGKPTETIEPVNPQKNSGEYNHFSLQTQNGSLNYYIAYTDFLDVSNSLNVTQINEMFNVARDAAIKGGRLVKESNLKLNEYQGREIEVESSDGWRIKSRMYWVYPRLYVLIVRTNTKTLPPASDRFLNSFRLLKTQAQKSSPSLPERKTNISPKDEAARLYQEGSDLYGQNRFQEAIEKLQQAWEIAKKSGDREYETLVLSRLGRSYHHLKQYDKALEIYQQTLVIVRSLGIRQVEGIMLDYIGSIYNAQGQYQKAMDFHEQALTIFKETVNLRSQAIVMSNMGEVFANLNQTQKALESLEKSLSIFLQIGDKENARITVQQIQRLQQKK